MDAATKLDLFIQSKMNEEEEQEEEEQGEDPESSEDARPFNRHEWMERIVRTERARRKATKRMRSPQEEQEEEEQEEEQEEEEEEQWAQQTCSRCKSVLPDDGKHRVRHRKRQCGKCLHTFLAQRLAYPCHQLQHRWYNAAKKRWPEADKSLWSMSTVCYVYQRWQGRSVINGSADIANLCISYFMLPPTIETLVLLTSREAMSLARRENREEFFPEHIRRQLTEEMNKTV
jgi:hypothetical protein